MRRFPPRTTVLLVTVVPLWVACVVLSVKSMVRRTGFSSVYVAAPARPDGHPTLVGFKRWLDGERSGLRVGDELLQIGASELTGVGAFGFWIRITHEAGPDPAVPVVFARAGERHVTQLPVGSLATYSWRVLPASIVFGLAGTFLLVRARPSPMVQALAEGFLCAAIAWASYFGGSRLETSAAMVIHLVAFSLIYPLSLRAVGLFPNDLPPPGRWWRAAPWLLLPLGAVEASTVFGAPLPAEIGIETYYWGAAACFALMVWVGASNYRQADPIGRRQLKWAVLGLYAGGLPPVVGYALAAADPRFTPVALLSLAATGLFPTALVLAVTRYNLWDVDRVITATATYNLLLVLAAAVALGLVPPAARAASTMLAIDPATGQVALSVMLGALIVPVAQRIRPRLDRLFFPERHAVEQGIGHLLAALSTCEDPGALVRATAVGVCRLFRPETCVLYGHGESAYVPIFVDGRAVPPGFDRGGSLVTALQHRRAPLVPPDPTSRHPSPPLDPFDRAALDTLGTAVVLPVWHGGALWAFCCLGRKRSGDVYTPTDLLLLLAVTEKLADALCRFDDAEVIRKSHAMQHALRRYVPGAVAAQLSAGALPSAGERELSVLFVDIRGYTTLSESRQAQEVFSLVNRYTATVSGLVQRHGGAVVEFHGDGLLAVFGAPLELPAKEEAAVAAARAVIAAVDTVAARPTAPDPLGLSVGAGIATGRAFVGDIQATDRAIWTAIGDTVNTAARLQALTRDLDAFLVVDEATWHRLGDASGDFRKRKDVSIRGRRQRLDLYVLPRRETPPASACDPMDHPGSPTPEPAG